MTQSVGSGNCVSLDASLLDAGVPLESILRTDELQRRPCRAPNHEKENRALVALAGALAADSSNTILQTLAETILEVTESDSSGLSLLTTEDGGKRFYWPAIAGVWKPHIGGGTPRNFGPCGDVLDRNCSLLFQHFERRYPYLLPVMPPAEECLLVPFYVQGKAVGTIWAIMHDDHRKFDAEDERLMKVLGQFASLAYQTLVSIDDLKFQVAARKKAEAESLALANGFETQVRVRTQQLESRNRQLAETKARLIEEKLSLKRNEAYLAGAQKLSHTGSWHWNVATQEAFLSQELLAIFGFDSEKDRASYSLFFNRIHPDDRSRVDALWQAAIREKKDFEDEYRILLPGGSIKYVHSNGQCLVNQSGDVEYIGAVMDITERKRAEDELRATMSERTRLAALREEIGMALARTGSLRGILNACAEAAVRNLDAAFARIWTLSSDGRELELQASAGMYTRLDGRYSRIPIGDLKIGRIAQERKPNLTNDVQDDPRIDDKDWARSEELKSFAGYPLLVNDRVVGVMGMFSRKMLSQSTLDTLALISDGIAQGIERKRAEDALRQSEGDLAEAQRVAKLGNWKLNFAGDSLKWSEELYRISDVDRDAFGGVYESFLAMVHIDDRERVLHANRKARESGEPFDLEYRIVTRSGEVKHIREVGYAMKDTHGRVLGLFGTAQDITDRKRAEQELRQSEDRIRAILEFSPNWIFLKDTEGRYLLVNREVERVFRLSQEQIKGKTDSEIFPPEQATEYRANDLKVLREGLTMEFEEIADLEDGRHTSIVHKFPLFDSHGNIYATGGVATDITERKRADQQLRRLSGELLRSQDEERRRIARDLHDSTGQNLVALATMLGQLRGSIPSGDRKPRRLLSECKALAEKCIREVRTLSYVLHPPLLDDAGLAEAIRDYVKGFTKRSGIAVELEVPQRMGRLAPDIELVLFRVVQESLTNVQVHAGSAKAKIRIDRGPDRLTLEVSDSGSGGVRNPSEGAPKSAFHVGVGIPSMQERVKLVGGHFQIDARSPGTIVRVTIPLREEIEKTSDSIS